MVQILTHTREKLVFVQKNRDVFNPLEQTLEFKNKEDMWNEEISYIKDQLNEHKKN